MKIQGNQQQQKVKQEKFLKTFKNVQIFIKIDKKWLHF